MKAQAALEYLMTYGWAILIIVIAIGALYAMGVFNVGTGNTCSPCFAPGTDFVYQDHSVTGDILYLSLREGASEVTINNMTVTDGTNTKYNDTSVTMSANSQQIMLVNVTGMTSTSAYSLDVTISYTKNGVPHTATATLHVSP